MVHLHGNTPGVDESLYPSISVQAVHNSLYKIILIYEMHIVFWCILGEIGFEKATEI